VSSWALSTRTLQVEANSTNNANTNRRVGMTFLLLLRAPGMLILANLQTRKLM
jgi:hypothetical protein